jgi:hypothetical protein
MAEFAEVSRQWGRMCKTMDTLYGDKCCDVCSLGGCGAVYEQDGTEDYAEIERKVMEWAKENPEPVYPSWGEWLQRLYNNTNYAGIFITPIPADIAQKLGIEPKEG